MNRLEDRLRDAFRADADTVRPETIPSMPARPTQRRGRRRSRRAQILVPLAAAAAVIAVVTGVAVIVPPALVRGSGPGASPTATTPVTSSPTPSASASTAPPPSPVLGHDGKPASKGVPASASSPGMPPYYVVGSAQGTANSLVVRATATGTLVATIYPPRGTAFGAVAATAGGQTFIASIAPAGNACETQSQLYQFQLSSDGVPGPLTPLNIAVPGDTQFQTATLAITPDGRTIAYETWLCGPNQEFAEFGVINLASSQVRTWEVTGDNPEMMGLSLSPDGSLLAYQTLNGGAAILRTSAPSGSVAALSQVVSGTAAWVSFGDNGTSVYTCSVQTNAQDTVGSVTYDVQPVAGGSRHVVASWNNLPSPQCWASADPSGGYLLVQYPVQAPSGDGGFVQPAVLNLSTGQLRLIAAPSFYGPLDAAW